MVQGLPLLHTLKLLQVQCSRSTSTLVSRSLHTLVLDSLNPAMHLGQRRGLPALQRVELPTLDLTVGRRRGSYDVLGSIHDCLSDDGEDDSMRLVKAACALHPFPIIAGEKQAEDEAGQKRVESREWYSDDRVLTLFASWHLGPFLLSALMPMKHAFARVRHLHITTFTSATPESLCLLPFLCDRLTSLRLPARAVDDLAALVSCLTSGISQVERLELSCADGGWCLKANPRAADVSAALLAAGVSSRRFQLVLTFGAPPGEGCLEQMRGCVRTWGLWGLAQRHFPHVCLSVSYESWDEDEAESHIHHVS